MVQILPEEKGWGGLLGETLGTGVGTGLQGLIKQHRTEQQQQKSALGASKLLNRPELEDALKGMPLELHEPIIKELIKGSGEQGLEQRKQTKYANVATQIEKVMEGGLMARTPLSESGREKIAEINSLSEQMFAAVRGDLTKGNMNQKIFDFIKNRVTINASDTDATMRGKLKAFRQIIGLNDYANLDEKNVNKILKTNIKESRKEFGEKEYGKGTGRQMVAILPPGSKNRNEAVLVPPNEVSNAIKEGGKRIRGFKYE